MIDIDACLKDVVYPPDSGENLILGDKEREEIDNLPIFTYLAE